MNTSKENSLNTLKKYYNSFNNQNLEDFYSCLHPDVIHDINEGAAEVGLPLFKKFMERMNSCYKEHLENIELMSNEAGTRLAARFVVKGTYLKTDAGLPPARGQNYSLPAGAFFEIKDGLIARVTMYYNLADWIKQVQ